VVHGKFASALNKRSDRPYFYNDMLNNALESHPYVRVQKQSPSPMRILMPSLSLNSCGIRKIEAFVSSTTRLRDMSCEVRIFHLCQQ
jgi:hypothetical protein